MVLYFLNMDSNTIDYYLSLLEQTFVWYRLPSSSNNQRNESKKSKKIDVQDLGIRNAWINDVRAIENRLDTGTLFENLIIYEIGKQDEYNQVYANFYF